MTRSQVLLASIIALLAAAADCGGPRFVVAGGPDEAVPSTAGGPANDKDQADDGGPVTGVYVPDSGEALQKIRQAKRLAEGKLWDQAAQLLHEVQTRYGGKVIAEEPGLYVSVTEQANDVLASWPEEGLAAYRRRYDGLARQAYEEAAASGGAVEMAAVARRFWVSSIGAQAADEAAELALESGRFATAADLWNRLLTRAPKGSLDKSAVAPVLAKLAVAYAWNGQPEEARQARQRLARDYPDWPNTFGGTNGRLAQWAASFDQSLLGAGGVGASAGGNEGKNYPILGGAMDRNGIASTRLSFGAELWSFERHKGDGAGSASENSGVVVNGNVVFAGGRRVRRGDPAKLLLCPVVANGVIYLSAPGGLYAVGAISGTLLWHNDEYRVAGRANPYNPYGLPAGAGKIYTATYADGRVYVDFGGAVNVNPYMGGAGNSGNGIACIDAADGKRLWWKFEVDSLPACRGGLVDSSPLAFGGRVFVVVHAIRTVFDSCLVVALDARTGKVLWQQQVSEADTGGGYGFFRGAGVLPAAEGNTLYLATNNGTVAALAADNGAVRWLREYERPNRVLNGRNGLVMGYRPPVPPTNEICPTFFWNGRVIVAPADSDDLLVLDAQTGKVIEKVDRKSEMYGAKEFFGIVDGKLYGRGTQVFCWDLAANKRAWARSIDGEVSYRGCLTRQNLYIPTPKELVRFDLAKGGEAEPEKFQWGPAAEGSILLTDQQIISVSATRMAGFCEWAEAERRALAGIAAAPPDKKPDAHLVYAQYAYATNHLALAREQLARAVELAGGFATLTQPDLKRQVFSYALDFARAAAKQEPPDPKATLDLLTMASLCPPDVEGHVRYRFALAAYWRDHDNPAQAVRYDQEVLSDPTLRAAEYAVDDETRAKAGQYARESIDRLIEAAGIERAYHAVAAQADGAYNQALARRDWNEVEQLAYRYPNAARTRAELFRLADHYAGIGQYDAAIDRLRFLRREYAQTLDHQSQEDIEALTRLVNYSLDLSRQWLDKKDVDERQRARQAFRALQRADSYLTAGRKYPQSQIKLGGVVAGFTEHRAQLEKQYPRLRQALPNVAAPLRASGELSPMGNNVRLLKPLLSEGPAPLDDVVLVGTMNERGWELRAYRPSKSSEPIWEPRKYDLATGGNTNVVTYNEDQAILAQGPRLRALDLDSGRVLWTVEARGARESALQMFARHENYLFAAPAQGGSGVVVDLDSGATVGGELSNIDAVNTQPVMSDRLLCYLSRQPMARLAVLDWRTGRKVEGFDGVGGDCYWVELAMDGRAVLVGGSQTVQAYDTESGKLLWKDRVAAGGFYGGNATAVRGRYFYSAAWSGGQWHVVMRDVADKGKIVRDRAVSATPRAGPTGQPRLTVIDDELAVIGMGDNTAAVLDADTLDISWEAAVAKRGDYAIRDALVTQDYLILACAPNQGRMVAINGRVPQMQCELQIYDRTPGGGRLEQSLPVMVENFGQVMIVPASPGLVVQSHLKLLVFQPADSGPKEKASKTATPLPAAALP